MNSARNETSEAFYAALPSFDMFASVTNPDRYKPLPDDWVVALADVVASTQAITEGRYREVNTVGAAVIAAVTNALPGVSFPFAFGGDGASLSVPSYHAAVVRDALSRTAAWSEDALDLKLRVAVVPIAEIRRAGYDVKVARYSAGGTISYAMFSGGGVAWAEARMKEGAYRFARAASGAFPDLDGLTCGFETIASRQGVILTIIAVPLGDGRTFEQLVDRLVRLIEGTSAQGPLPLGIAGDSIQMVRLSAAIERAQTKLEDNDQPDRGGSAMLIPALGNRMSADEAELAPPIYDTDFRRFEDGLRMTIDCAPATAEEIESILKNAHASGVCRFGTHRQAAANLTCLLPPKQSRHAHFIDGADGGYASAAAKLKLLAMP